MAGRELELGERRQLLRHNKVVRLVEVGRQDGRAELVLRVDDVVEVETPAAVAGLAAADAAGHPGDRLDNRLPQSDLKNMEK